LPDVTRRQGGPHSLTLMSYPGQGGAAGSGLVKPRVTALVCRPDKPLAGLVPGLAAGQRPRAGLAAGKRPCAGLAAGKRPCAGLAAGRRAPASDRTRSWPLGAGRATVRRVTGGN
jgi:hypothetical protein